MLTFQWVFPSAAGSAPDLYGKQHIQIHLSSIWNIQCSDGLLRPVMAHLRFWGLRTVIYLDDILVMAGDQEQLQHQVQQTISLLEQLGFTVNRTKSVLEPSH